MAKLESKTFFPQENLIFRNSDRHVYGSDENYRPRDGRHKAENYRRRFESPAFEICVSEGSGREIRRKCPGKWFQNRMYALGRPHGSWNHGSNES